MHESEDDLDRLQELLDASYAGAGRHLLSIHTPERRLDARRLVPRLDGVCLLTLATVTTDGRPIAGPVEGVFYRGSFYFGSGSEPIRFRHLSERPAVSAVHLPGEDLAVTVHGQATEIDVAGEVNGGFRRTLLDIYLPRYGPEWERFLEGDVAYARIAAERMFAFATPTE